MKNYSNYFTSHIKNPNKNKSSKNIYSILPSQVLHYSNFSAIKDYSLYNQYITEGSSCSIEHGRPSFRIDILLKKNRYFHIFIK